MKVNFPLFKGELPCCVSGEVQTRSEYTGLCQWSNLQRAVDEAEWDDTIWKISYQTEDGWKRIVIR